MKVRNRRSGIKHLITVFIMTFAFFCCGNMTANAATCTYEHTFGNLDFLWASNYTDACVYIQCKECGQRYDYVGIAAVQVVNEQQATCTEPGVSEYRASIEYNGQEYYCSEIVTTSEALGHEFGDFEYKWADNLKSCTAIRSCKRNNSHQEAYVVKGSMVATKQMKAPTCTEKGTTRITALFEEETRDVLTGAYIVPDTYIDVENIEIDPTAHTKGIITKDKKEETCTESGYTGNKVYECCGAVSESGSKIEAKGHSYDMGTITTAPTCSKKGVKTYTCRVCNDKKTEEIAIDSSNHSGEKVVKNALAATCGNAGYTGDSVCNSCGTVISSGTAIEKTQNHKAAALVIENVKAADCTQSGSYDNVAYCEVCLEEMSRTTVETKALGHTWVSSGTLKELALNNTTGSQRYVCSVCGATKTEAEDGTHTHIYEKSVVPATEKSDGKIEWKCGECQDVKSSEAISRIKNVELSSYSFTYNGKSRKPTVKLTSKDGNAIDSQFYTVTYKNNKSVGTASVTVTMKGDYSGTLTATFQIIPKKVSISRIEALSKGMKIQWKKNMVQTSGYQIQYATNSSFKNAMQKTISGNKKTCAKITGLSAGKKYYVRIRTYKTVDGKKIYSDWSVAKRITTKK